MNHDLIFLSLENWDDIWRRNQFICAALARRHPKMRILFVGLPRDVSNRIRRLNFAGMAAESAYPVEDCPNVTVLHPLKCLPNSIPPARRFNEMMYRNAIRKAARGLGMRNPVLWVNPHWAGHCVGHLGESAALYDITDDWTAFTQSPRLIKLIQEQDAALCRTADATIVCSQQLYKLKDSLTDHLHLIPNGVDAAHYAGVLEGALEIPEVARSWPKPVFGYTGTIHPDRVDVGLLVHLATALPKATFALVGPNMLPAEDLARLTNHANVKLTGPVPYGQIPHYMAAFNVCMTPHRVSAFTESLNPIKLWEYLAAGKPIVATDVAGFRDYPSLVAIARSVPEFVAALQAALFEDPRKAAARQAEARKHSWESRVGQVEAVIESILHRTQRPFANAV